MTAIQDYFEQFTQDLLASAGAEADFTRSRFVDQMCGMLVEEAVIDAYTQVDYKHSSQGLAVDAWSYNEDTARLTLFVCDFRDGNVLESLTRTQIDKSFGRVQRFVIACMKSEFVEGLDESMAATELAYFLQREYANIDHLTLVLLSNAELSHRVGDLPTISVGSKRARTEVWEMGRLHRTHLSGAAREEIEIDLLPYEKGGVSCLPAFTGADSVESYLLAISGELLADLYDKYGERLLEQNVRTFLQFRGKVNKGLKNTIDHEPHMFFSYNNGIAATAEGVTRDLRSGKLVSIRNLQIVNGGQTTATIFNAGKGGADLSKVYVQMKLSVVPLEAVERVVPRISEYANTQNKVNAADFFSNHPFHLRMEGFSRRMFAPAPDGGVLETHWFYERARGQYANQQANLSSSERKAFLLQNPRRQMFTKTDLAKYILTFEMAPHEVSMGAQKAFAGSPRTPGLVGRIANQWEKDSTQYNEVWFKRAIAMAILFRDTDRLVFAQPWYGGYKANIVTYAIAKFVSMVRAAGLYVDLLSIWKAQALPLAVEKEILNIAEMVNELLMSPPQGATSNVSEWAKRKDCWTIVEAARMSLNPEVEALMLHAEDNADTEHEGSRTQVIQDGIHAQEYVFGLGAEHWMKLKEWNMSNRKLSPKELQILDYACAMPRKIPSEKQCPILIRAEKRAIEEGFYVG